LVNKSLVLLGFNQENHYHNRMTPRRYVICDIEATGLDEHKEIIEIALMTFEEGKILEVYETLINPLRPVSEFIQDLTSISARDLQQAPKFYEVAEGIKRRLEGSVFVSHNTDFDLGLLKKKFEEMGESLKVKNFCTLKVAQIEIPGMRSYTLDALCDFFRIKMRNRHRAIGDAEATLELFKELLDLRINKTEVKPLHLPHHEKLFKNVPHQAGLVTLKDKTGKTVEILASSFMDVDLKKVLLVKQENKFLLERVEEVIWEATGSALIAEFKRLLYYPHVPQWMIVVQELDSKEKVFKIRPYKKNVDGLWYFKDYQEARFKMRHLERDLKDQKFIFRDGPKSKEEIMKHNQKIENLSKSARFPTPHLIILGEGRSLGEKSFIHIRDGHVQGFGYSCEKEERILENPESFYTRRIFRHLGSDLAAKRYIRELKNMRQKHESWRSLAKEL
jgi:DNA polymerase III subunit epsilon